MVVSPTIPLFALQDGKRWDKLDASSMSTATTAFVPDKSSDLSKRESYDSMPVNGLYPQPPRHDHGRPHGAEFRRRALQMQRIEFHIPAKLPRDENHEAEDRELWERMPMAVEESQIIIRGPIEHWDKGVFGLKEGWQERYVVVTMGLMFIYRSEKEWLHTDNLPIKMVKVIGIQIWRGNSHGVLMLSEKRAQGKKKSGDLVHHFRCHTLRRLWVEALSQARRGPA
mmetsp:Transcript_67565/g.126248  ORF Transcript_67565/g.126248 Transcript_67565/m.126248 type:complete len:226 (+) Transcript_67565:83-760(+)